MTTISEEFETELPADMTNIWPSLSPGYDWAWGWVQHDDSWKLEDGQGAGLKNTTGWTAEMELRESQNGPLVKKISTATGEIVNDNNGSFSVTLPAAVTAKFSTTSLMTNIRMIDNLGGKTNLFTGSIDVIPVVTR